MAGSIYVYRWKRINPLNDHLEDPGQIAYDTGQMDAVKGIVDRDLPSPDYLVNRLTDARTPRIVKKILDSVRVNREIEPPQ